MRWKLMTTLWLTLGTACLPKGDDDDTGANGAGPWGDRESEVSSPGASGSPVEVTDTTDPEEPEGLSSAEVSLSVHSGGVSLSISSDGGTGYDFGIAEDCDDPDNCWLAESCVTDTAGYAFCHDAGVTGVELTGVSSPDEVVSSATTLFHDGVGTALGFMLDDGDDCYAWGDYAAFFVDAAGCERW